jgi:ribA/ribD-fused uncharacterized protein
MCLLFMSTPDACSSSSSISGGGGSGDGAQPAPSDYLTDGEFPQLRYSRATIGHPSPPFFMFWGHADGSDKSFLSQWFPSPFLYDGRQYSCAEQWMMAEKARVFGDEETRELILAAATPKEMKALGRSIRGFDEERWRRCRERVVMKGTVLKFSQNPPMLQFLLSTSGVLVEASPYDTIWGIGKCSAALDVTIFGHDPRRRLARERPPRRQPRNLGWGQPAGLYTHSGPRHVQRAGGGASSH